MSMKSVSKRTELLLCSVWVFLLAGLSMLTGLGTSLI